MEAAVALYVYQVTFTGSAGTHQMGPLYTHRKLAVDQVQQYREEHRRLPPGVAIFGDYAITRLAVVGTPTMI